MAACMTNTIPVARASSPCSMHERTRNRASLQFGVVRTGRMPVPQGSLGRRMIHLNLDDAWEEGVLGMTCVDARAWGPRVRYFAPQRVLDEFYQNLRQGLPPG